MKVKIRKTTVSYLWLLAIVGMLAMLIGPQFAGVQAAPSSVPTGQRLRLLAGPFHIGFASVNNFWSLSDAALYQETARTEFNILTPENAMKWDSIHPQQSTYSFAQADQHVQWAQANGMAVHGHTLVWHSQNPSWLTSGSWTAATLTNVLYDHIDTVMGRYQGDILVWDVVNEAFDDGAQPRNSVWRSVIGPNYIDMAFQRARAADPQAKLIYNDYNIETINSKSTAVYNMVSGMKSRGIPIDGVGFQMHLTSGGLNYQSFADNMQRFAQLGLEIYITEMDVRYPAPISQANLAAQANIYGNVLDRCLAQPACKALQVWGFTDKYSWVPDFEPGSGDALIFDANYNAKPAYYALQVELGGGQTPTPTRTNTPGTPPITPSRTSTITPSNTPTQPVGSNNTGWISPSAQAAQSGGDGNGFQTNPANAFADGGGTADDVNSGTGTSTSCTSTSKDRHTFFNYPLSIPAGVSVTGIEVRTDARADSASGTRRFCVDVSWNNGASWTAMKQTANLSTTEASYILGSSSDTWGRTWNVNELTNANFRVRIVSVGSSTSRDFFLDWIPVRVWYSGGGGVTNTPTFTPTPTRTFTASPTSCAYATPEPLWVEPVTSPTNQNSQIITVRAGNSDSVTVTHEFGSTTVTGSFSTANPALVTVPLQVNAIHNLTVSAHVRPSTGPGGCTYGNYTLTTTRDRYGASLTIVQTSDTVTPTFTPTTEPVTLRLQYRAADTNAGDNQIKPHFNIVNPGTSPVPLSELKIRYWYTREGTAGQNFWCDYSAISGGCGNLSGAFVPVSPVRAGADFYLEVSFNAAAGSIAAGGQSGEIQARFAKTDWSNYTETGDYSFDPTKTTFTDWTRVTLYRNGVLVWGTEP